LKESNFNGTLPGDNMNRDDDQDQRLYEVLNQAWEISQFTLARWLRESGLAPSKRSALGRLLGGQPCEGDDLVLSLLDVAARVMSVPLNELARYVRYGILAANSRLALCLAARVWYPNPRNIDEQLYRVWLAGRREKTAHLYSAALPEFLLPPNITGPVHRALAVHAGGDVAPVVDALDSYRRQRWFAMQQPDRPRHIFATISLTGMMRMARLEFPFGGCTRRDMNECIETFRFVHLTRSDLTVRILDDRQPFSLQRHVHGWDTIGCIENVMAVARLAESPATLWYDRNASASEASIVSYLTSILFLLRTGRGCSLLSEAAGEIFLERLGVSVSGRQCACQSQHRSLAIAAPTPLKLRNLPATR
jgi:hypothetical protein